MAERCACGRIDLAWTASETHDRGLHGAKACLAQMPAPTPDAAPGNEGVEGLAERLYVRLGWSGCAGSSWERTAEPHRRKWLDMAEKLTPEFAQVRAEALRKAADDWERVRRMESRSGVVAPWTDACQYLRARADREVAAHDAEGDA